VEIKRDCIIEPDRQIVQRSVVNEAEIEGDDLPALPPNEKAMRSGIRWPMTERISLFNSSNLKSERLNVCTYNGWISSTNGVASQTTSSSIGTPLPKRAISAAGFCGKPCSTGDS
jgi:hypothetical protein